MLQPLRESYQTDSSFTKIESIRVAVPIELPVVGRPSEVFDGRRTHTEAEQADLSVMAMEMTVTRKHKLFKLHNVRVACLNRI
jgi:hypothetical protein